MTRAEILEKAKPFLTGVGAVKCIYVAENGQVFRHASLAHRFEHFEGVKVHAITQDDFSQGPAPAEVPVPQSSGQSKPAKKRGRKPKTTKE